MELNEEKLEQLIDAGNKALNDYYHEEVCACDAWPERCLSSGRYFFGTWDTNAFAIGAKAIIEKFKELEAQGE